MKMRVPEYLLKIITSYFKDRLLLYDTESGPKTYRITGGVPQGSVLGPILWNIMYDGILRIEKPDVVHVVGYADDIAIVVVAKTLDEVARNCSATIAAAKSWLQYSGLELAEHKTEVLLISSRKKIEQLSIKVGGVDIQSSPQLTYLGVTLDSRLSFKTHLKQSGDKASRVCNALSRLMLNIGGPKDTARVLLASVSKSVMLYAAPVWAHATTIKSYSRVMKSAHRLSNLRICRATIEAQFAVAAITSDITQFNTVVAAIESSVIADVSDAVLHPPETGRYANLKACIIERYSESEQRKIQRLLSEVELGDRRPTQLLTELTALAKDKVSDEFLKSLWLKRLPPQVRAILQASNVALAELAKLADRICEAGDFQQIAVASASDCPAYSENAVILRRLEQIEQRLSRLDLRRSESVQSRSSSRRRRRTRSRPGSHPDWCWYHE
ncbi:uncharacterized protein LOC119665228, partial [Teleopsis dalmanni]|uniref:uncharacterized protein LOC119665228 n=1 Tax=Teleopsis dalmanni TaxID=139649 RepID=UPI0018CE372B